MRWVTNVGIDDVESTLEELRSQGTPVVIGTPRGTEECSTERLIKSNIVGLYRTDMDEKRPQGNPGLILGVDEMPMPETTPELKQSIINLLKEEEDC